MLLRASTRGGYAYTSTHARISNEQARLDDAGLYRTRVTSTRAPHVEGT